MVMGFVFFEVRTEYLNIIETSFGFKGLKSWLIRGNVLRIVVIYKFFGIHFGRSGK
jgi:hypothetical protein